MKKKLFNHEQLFFGLAEKESALLIVQPCPSTFVLSEKNHINQHFTNLFVQFSTNIY